MSLSSVSGMLVSSVADGEYELYLASLGFETRSRYVSENVRPRAKRSVICAFHGRQVHAFAENEKAYKRLGLSVEFVDDTVIQDWTESLMMESQRAAKGSTFRVCVDVSSMSRLRLASVVSAFMRLSERGTIEADFVYAIAAWTPPSEEPEIISTVGSVIPYFAGWSTSPAIPTIAVVGLGYEPDKAVGAYEYLEASGVWVFKPIGMDRRYEVAVERSNNILLQRVPVERQLCYRIDSPRSCFGLLESVVFGLRQDGRPVLLPFGPKVFSLCALLVACVHRDVPVWRVSSEQHEDAADRVASGEVVSLRAVFSPQRDSDQGPDSVDPLADEVRRVR